MNPEQQPATRPVRRSRGPVAAAAVAAAALALTFACYGPSLRAEFVSDDINAIVENEWVRVPVDAVGIATNFSWWGQGRADSPGWRPAATLSFALNRAASGLDPYGFRIVNFAMHALCSLLLFALASALGLGIEASCVAALLFAVLPIHSEAVIWIVGRAELGAAAGFLTAAWMTVVHRRSGSIAALALAALAVAVGMAFKENAVTVLAWPLILLVAARAGSPASFAGPAGGDPAKVPMSASPVATPGAATAAPAAARAQRRESAKAKRRRPSSAPGAPAASAPSPAPASTTLRSVAALAALLAGVAAYAMLRMAADGPPIVQEPGSLIDNPLSVVDPFTRMLGALAVLGRYVALTAWPFPLSVDYSYDALGIGPGFRGNGDTLVALAFLAVAAWAALRGPGRRAVTIAGLLMAAASYSIVSNTVFVLGTILGERLFYLPSAGLCLAVAAMTEPAFRTASRRLFPPREATGVRTDADAQTAAGNAGEAIPPVAARTGPVPLPAFATVAVFAVLLCAAVVVDRRRAEEWSTPVSLFEAAVRAVPRSARAQMELASAYGNAGRVDEALPHFDASLAILPDFAAAAYNRGNALAKAGRLEEAAASYRRAVAATPRLLRAWHNLELSEQQRGNRQGWIDALKGKAAAFADTPAIGDEVGETLIRAGAYADAVAVYDALVDREEATVASRFNRGVARHHLGGCAAAIDDYRRAASMPGAPREVLATAAGCLKELGRDDEAAALEKPAQVANRDTRR